MQIVNVSENAKKTMRQYLGDESDAFFTRANSFMAKYADLWKLTNIRPISPASDGNIVFSCDSELYGACVLYMHMNSVENEVQFLNIYGGKGYCKLYAHSLEDNVLLVEKITPGIFMWDAVVDFRERARIVAELVKDLPIPHEIGDLPTYGSWMEGIHNILTEMGGLDDVLFYLNKAMEIYVELKQRYPRNCLLDANLQRFNLFLNESGSFTVTDPQSVVDDPIMQTARFLNNERPNTLMDATPNVESLIREMAAIISSITEVPAEDVLKSMFIDTALSNCWTLDEFYHFPKRDGLEETKKDVLKSCGFVYGLIQSTM